MTRDWIPNPSGKGSVEHHRTAKFAAETYADPSEFKTRREWIEALDEALTDLAHARGLKPSVTILATLEEMCA